MSSNGAVSRGRQFAEHIFAQERKIIERDDKETRTRLRELERERVRQATEKSGTNTTGVTNSQNQEQEIDFEPQTTPE
jgi:hypothetical protein